MSRSGMVRPGAPRLSGIPIALSVALGIALVAPAARAQPSPSEKTAPSTGATPVISAPELLSFELPAVPEEARRLGLEAEVLLELEVGADGKVRAAQVRSPMGHGFDEAAQAAALGMLFKPASRDGKPVAARIHFKVPFRLPPEEPSSTPAAPAAVSAPPEAFQRANNTVTAPASPAKAGAAAAPSPTEAIEIDVTGEQPAREVTRRSLSARELSTLPGARGDALSAIQNLPGIVPMALGTNQLIVRGTEPQSTLVSVDGLLVPQAYHLWGLSSVVPTEMIDRLDFFPGNYSVRYGRGLGGLIDISTRDPKEGKQAHGFAQVDIVDARALVEGPVPGLKGWSFIGAVRRSHLDAVAMPVLGWDISPVYYDFQAFLVNHPNSHSRLRLGVLGSHDNFSFDSKSDVDRMKLAQSWGFLYFTSSYENRFSDRATWTHSVTVGQLSQEFAFAAANKNYSAKAPAYPFATRTELALRPMRGLSFNLGTDIQYAPFRTELRIPSPRATDSEFGQVASPFRPPTDFTTSQLYLRPAVYAEGIATPTPTTRIVAGARLDYSKDTGRFDVSPRIMFRQDLIRQPRRTTIKGGLGLVYQPPLPEQVLPGFGTPSLRSSHGVQASLGIEQELTPSVEFSVEGYSYWLRDLVQRQANASGQLDFTNSGHGQTYGLETLLRVKPTARLYGWLAYTLSRSVRTPNDAQPLTLFDSDCTHVLTALGSYRVGRGWELGGKFQYISGFPYTPWSGALFSSSTNSYVGVPGATNSSRFPAYHELTLRAQKRWVIGKRGALTAYLELINLYGKNRVLGVNCSPDLTQCAYQKYPMPLIPNLGFRGEF